jgi:hypothetical protein
MRMPSISHLSKRTDAKYWKCGLPGELSCIQPRRSKIDNRHGASKAPRARKKPHVENSKEFVQACPMLTFVSGHGGAIAVSSSILERTFAKLFQTWMTRCDDRAIGSVRLSMTLTGKNQGSTRRSTDLDASTYSRHVLACVLRTDRGEISCFLFDIQLFFCKGHDGSICNRTSSKVSRECVG